MKKTLLILMLAATGCSHAQVKPLGEETLDLERFGFDTEITDLYPEKNKNTFYPDGNVFNICGEEDGFFERKTEKNGHRIFADDIQKEVVVYKQYVYTNKPLARLGKQTFGVVNTMTTPDGRIVAVNASARNSTQSQHAELVACLTEKYGTPTRLQNDWDENAAPVYEWTGEDRIIRCVHAVDKSAVLQVDLSAMQISQENGQTVVSHLFIINPELKGEVFPGGKRCTVYGNFGYINGRAD